MTDQSAVQHAETNRPRGAGPSARPVWLLDVDGVINASRPPWGAAPRQGTGYAFGQPWRIRWAPALLDRIRSWHESDRVELRWATTWCPFVDPLERLWGLPALEPCLSDEEAASPGTAVQAKLRAALGVLEEEQRALVWADDDAIPTSGSPPPGFDAGRPPACGSPRDPTAA